MERIRSYFLPPLPLTRRTGGYNARKFEGLTQAGVRSALRIPHTLDEAQAKARGWASVLIVPWRRSCFAPSPYSCSMTERLSRSGC